MIIVLGQYLYTESKRNFMPRRQTACRPPDLEVNRKFHLGESATAPRHRRAATGLLREWTGIILYLLRPANLSLSLSLFLRKN